MTFLFASRALHIYVTVKTRSAVNLSIYQNELVKAHNILLDSSISGFYEVCNLLSPHFQNPILKLSIILDFYPSIYCNDLAKP